MENIIEIDGILFYESTMKQLEEVEILAMREKARIQSIEAMCGEIIKLKYSIEKQLNITNLLTPYTLEDKEAMKLFIDEKRTICHKAIEQGVSIESIDWKI